MNCDISRYFAVVGNADEPRYEQVRSGLRAYIQDHEVGTRLSSERKLSGFLEVDRETVRKALSVFVESGVVQRKRIRYGDCQPACWLYRTASPHGRGLLAATINHNAQTCNL